MNLLGMESVCLVNELLIWQSNDYLRLIFCSIIIIELLLVIQYNNFFTLLCVRYENTNLVDNTCCAGSFGDIGIFVLWILW
jgi:hypothetical protein